MNKNISSENNEVIQKIQKLEEENKKLKEDLNNINQNEMNKLKIEIEKLKKENEKLKDDLLKANKIISGFQNQKVDNNEIKILKEENINLKNQINIKNNEIINLKMKIQNNIIIEPKFNLNEIMVINFMSQDSTINEGIKCLPNEIFAEVEERLYKKYDNLRNTNNMFTANAKPILRFKKLNENGIKDGDKIQLFKLE